MRTTLEIPDALIEEAMALTHIPTKTKYNKDCPTESNSERKD